MLVLTRKPNEEIVIDGRIRVTVAEVRGGSVRIGITAPADVPVKRAELQPRGPGSADPELTAASR